MKWQYKREVPMRQTELFTDERSLFEKLCDTEYLKVGFEAVKRNGGAPGIDGVTVSAYGSRLDEELKQLKKELQDWTYQPAPVRRVEIPKPGKTGGVRLLGIPCIRDRVVQASLKNLLEPILEPNFSDNSYGFRPGRSQKQAVEAAQKIVQSGKEHVVDIDLSKFFDRVHHDRLISRLSQFIFDKRILRLIGITLRSGVMKDGLVKPTTEGTVQGSPLSPLLSNVVLDELDRELERRNLEFCRFADDCNIFVRTHKAAARVMDSIGRFIGNKLKLVINSEKSKIAHSSGVKFLGMTIINGMMVIAKESIKRAMTKIKELTPRGSHLKLEDTIKQFNRWYIGWANYYGMTQYPSQLRNIEAHFRRRLRSRIVGQQKKKRNLYAKLLKRGVSRKLAATVYSNKGRWATSISKAVHKGYRNDWFIEELGQKNISTEKRSHWLSSEQWIKLT